MNVDVCPYCRGPLLMDEPLTECEGCGTRHHRDCLEENGGCTIFGCAKAPVDEPKMTIATGDLATAAQIGQGATSSPLATRTMVAPPPPPPSVQVDNARQTLENLRRISSDVVPSMFNIYGPENLEPAIESEDHSVPEGQPKSRTTFILLGAVLGPLGAHNFYAGYTKKAIGQLAISVVTLGFGSPMSWIWAIIDICTVNHDNKGVQFAS